MQNSLNYSSDLVYFYFLFYLYNFAWTNRTRTSTLFLQAVPYSFSFGLMLVISSHGLFGGMNGIREEVRNTNIDPMYKRNLF